MPTLTAPVALEATEIYRRYTYQAQWEPVHGEEVDYYVITRTQLQGCSGGDRGDYRRSSGSHD